MSHDQKRLRGLRISSKPDWLDEWFGGMGVRRSNELRCPTRWECFVEAVQADVIQPIARLFHRKDIP